MTDELNFDEHFKKHLLNHLLRDSEFLNEANDVISDQIFADDTQQRLVRLCKDFLVENKAAPGTFAFRVLDTWRSKNLISEGVHKSATAYIEELFALPLQNRDYLLKEINRFARQQLAKTKILPFMEYIKKGEFESAEETMKEIFLFKPTRKQDLGRRLLVDPSERVERRKKEDPERFWTLIPELDAKVQALKRGETGVFQSQRSSIGKSAALQFLTRSFVYQGKKVLIYTMEMGEEAYEDRLDQCIAGITQTMLTDRMKIHSQLQKMFRHGGDIWIKQFPSYQMKIQDLRKHTDLIRNVHGFHPDAIILDIADLLLPDTDALRADIHQREAEIHGLFRGWMIDEHLVGWTGSQSGRGAMEDTFADMHKVGGSLAKTHIHDLIISLSRSPEEEKNGLTTLTITKNRMGAARFQITIKSDFSKMAFWTRRDD